MRKKKNLKKRSLALYRFSWIFKSMVILCIFIIGGIFFTMFTFFKVKSIECVGASPYPVSDIIESSRLKVGDNLILSRTKSAIKTVEEQFPYLEDVHIEKKLPDKIVIKTKTADNFLSVENSNKNLILSKNLKVLDHKDIPAEGSIVVKGIILDSNTIGKPANFSAEVNKQNFLDLLNLLKEHNLIDKIKIVDFSHITNVVINYDNRVDIKLGTCDKLDYKIRTIKELLKTKINPSEKGTLDLSMLLLNNRSYFNSVN